MSKVPVRFGVIGAGAISQLAHLPVLSKMRGAQLVALCDNDGAKARALADRFGVPDAFTDIEELLEYDELDAVVVATPNHLHEAHVLSALAMGIYPAESFGRIHHLPRARLAEVMAGLRDRGLLDASGRLTETGLATKGRIESLTDALAEAPYEALEPIEVDELIAVLEPISRTLRAAGS